METGKDLKTKFMMACAVHSQEDKIEAEKCKKIKEFVALVLEKLQPQEYMELAYRDVSQNVSSVIIGKGWVGTRTTSGDLTFEKVSDFNPCIGSKEYPARILQAAIVNPERAEIKIKVIRRHEFNSCYFKALDSHLSAQGK